MKKLLRWTFPPLAAVALLTGCSSVPKTIYHAGDETPPAFLTGPVAVLLTNVDGYSAQLTASMPRSGGGRRTLRGDLLERQGALIFQPANAIKGKRAHSEGGMFFIWNESLHSGYVLSDPLQGYAPTNSAAGATNVVLNSSAPVEEEVNGHPCRRIEAIVQSSDGSSERFQVWEAEDARHFPVRIRTASSEGGMTLDFTEVRIELPPPEIFGPPDGFIAYKTPVALINDLIVRQSAFAKDAGGTPRNPKDEGGGPLIQNWRPSTGQ